MDVPRATRLALQQRLEAGRLILVAPTRKLLDLVQRDDIRIELRDPACLPVDVVFTVSPNAVVDVPLQDAQFYTARAGAATRGRGRGRRSIRHSEDRAHR